MEVNDNGLDLVGGACRNNNRLDLVVGSVIKITCYNLLG